MLKRNRTNSSPGPAQARLWGIYPAAIGCPLLLAEELPENDCPPVRVKILSERLIAFRDSEGERRLIDEFCPHRGASLWFWRNEECGLRCPYHGWKLDLTGQCVEVSSELVECGYAKKIKVTSYPLVERGGALWTYMGPKERQPALPEWEFCTVPRAELRLEALPGMQLAAIGAGRRQELSLAPGAARCQR